MFSSEFLLNSEQTASDIEYSEFSKLIIADFIEFSRIDFDWKLKIDFDKSIIERAKAQLFMNFRLI